MRSRKGFTLIELMVVIVIVAILAAVVIPLLLSRVEKAKYSEGKAIASQIATAVRVYAVESDVVLASPSLTVNLGFKPSELDAKYFTQIGNMSVSGVLLNTTTGTMNYTITLIPDSGEGLNSGNVVLECTANNTVFTSPVGL
ncbi:MAG: hypothetical protein CEE38_05410 [Planctomycetes bacterium B3_Pla]|nr:MAG: hypothetical protein CEE38_05410 [Planctomycetes bacterium B3_Pla]